MTQSAGASSPSRPLLLGQESMIGESRADRLDDQSLARDVDLGHEIHRAFVADLADAPDVFAEESPCRQCGRDRDIPDRRHRYASRRDAA